MELISSCNYYKCGANNIDNGAIQYLTRNKGIIKRKNTSNKEIKMTAIMIHKQKFPSPHPEIELSLVTFDANGLKVKGLLAEPKG